MGFMENLQETLNEGFALSRDLIMKAGDKAKDVGEKGMIRFEIRQLETQSAKIASQLGLALYSQVKDGGWASLDARQASLDDMIKEIDGLRAKIEEKQKLLAQEG